MSHFLTVITVLLLIAGLSLGTMIWAYQGAGSVAILFAEVMPVPAELADTSQHLFQAGVAAYITGRYRLALDRFTQVTAQDPACTAALHNAGLTLANLRQDDKAAQYLLQAADRYLEADDKASADLVKQQLTKLRLRKKSGSNSH